MTWQSALNQASLTCFDYFESEQDLTIQFQGEQPIIVGGIFEKESTFNEPGKQDIEATLSLKKSEVGSKPLIDSTIVVNGERFLIQDVPEHDPADPLWNLKLKAVSV